MVAVKAARRIQARWLTAAAVLPVLLLASCTAVAQPDAKSATADTVSGVGALPVLAATDGSGAGSSAHGSSSTSTTANAVDAPKSTGVGGTSGTNDASTTSAASTTTTTLPTFPIGPKAAGDRLIMIGDSVTASISQRYGGQACAALVPLGWKVEVDAEVSRFIDFGKRVLDARLSAGWDVAVIFLGTNYGLNQGVYESMLKDLVVQLAPRPTILINSTLYRPQQQQVNDAIAYVAAAFPNVAVIDWASVSADPSLTGGDNIHLTEAGRRALAYQLAGAMGPAPSGFGACLPSGYQDNSAGSPYGPPGNATAPKKKKPAAPPTTTRSTTAPVVTIAPTGTTASTVKPTTSTTPTESTSTATSQVIVTTQPATTQAPITVAPTTAAPTTAPATTHPATTATPTTPAPSP